jgi:hypothetical protein
MEFREICIKHLASYFDIDAETLPASCLVERTMGRETYRKIFFVQLPGLEVEYLVYVFDFAGTQQEIDACREEFDATTYIMKKELSNGNRYAPKPLNIWEYSDYAVILAKL